MSTTQAFNSKRNYPQLNYSTSWRLKLNEQQIENFYKKYKDVIGLKIIYSFIISKYYYNNDKMMIPVMLIQIIEKYSFGLIFPLFRLIKIVPIKWYYNYLWNKQKQCKEFYLFCKSKFELVFFELDEYTNDIQIKHQIYFFPYLNLFQIWPQYSTQWLKMYEEDIPYSLNLNDNDNHFNKGKMHIFLEINYQYNTLKICVKISYNNDLCKRKTNTCYFNIDIQGDECDLNVALINVNDYEPLDNEEYESCDIIRT